MRWFSNKLEKVLTQRSNQLSHEDEYQARKGRYVAKNVLSHYWLLLSNSCAGHLKNWENAPHLDWLRIRRRMIILAPLGSFRSPLHRIVLIHLRRMRSIAPLQILSVVESQFFFLIREAFLYLKTVIANSHWLALQSTKLAAIHLPPAKNSGSWLHTSSFLTIREQSISAGHCKQWRRHQSQSNIWSSQVIN